MDNDENGRCKCSAALDSVFSMVFIGSYRMVLIHHYGLIRMLSLTSGELDTVLFPPQSASARVSHEIDPGLELVVNIRLALRCVASVLP